MIIISCVVHEGVITLGMSAPKTLINNNNNRLAEEDVSLFLRIVRNKMADKLKQEHGMQMNHQSPPQQLHHQQHLHQSPNYNLNISQNGGFIGTGGQNQHVGYTIGNLLAMPQNPQGPPRAQKTRVKGTKRANKEAKVQNGTGEYSEEDNGLDKKIA